MKDTLLTIFSLSRPRFWIYLAGPYLIGTTIASNSLTVFSDVRFWYIFLYFLIPANIILYGVNDISDNDTDKFNSKKDSKELRFSKKISPIYKNAILISDVLSLPLFLFAHSSLAIILLLLFFFLSVCYSLPPLRFKKWPILDSASNILYILPGIFGFVSITGVLPPVSVMLAASCWAIAMHLFSAIPDIAADKKAGLQTTAVLVGKNTSLILCTILWSLSVLPLASQLPLLLLFSFYPLLPVLLFGASRETIEKVYWLFPYINMVSGFVLWLLCSLKFIV